MSTELAVQEENGIRHQPTIDEVLFLAVEKGQVDAIERIVALKEQMERFQWEREERQSRIDFDDALNQCQAQIGRIAPNQKRGDNGAWWADYAQLDRAIRPIYTGARFSIAFSEVAPLNPGKVRVMGVLSRGGVSKEFFSEITPSMTGPKGNAMATATDADAIAQSRAKRYVLLDIFNISVGIDKEEKAATSAKEMMPDHIAIEWIDKIKESSSEDELKKNYFDAMESAKKLGDSKAISAFSQAKNETWRRIHGGAK